jgi:hypothetical protein
MKLPAHRAGLAGALPVISPLDRYHPFKIRKPGIPLIEGKIKEGQRVYVSIG